MDEKDINVSLDDNQLIVSGEKKAESTKEEKDWHVEERSYGSFYRSMLLPFEPEEGAVEAHFDKGVLHLKIKKPAKVVKTTKTISIKTGAPPSTSPVSNRPHRARPLSPGRSSQKPGRREPDKRFPSPGRVMMRPAPRFTRWMPLQARQFTQTKWLASVGRQLTNLEL